MNPRGVALFVALLFIAVMLFIQLGAWWWMIPTVCAVSLTLIEGN